MDKLSELEKVVLDYYLSKGYIIGTGDWSFKVEITSKWKFKQLNIFFWDKGEVTLTYFSVSATTEDMFTKAIDFFKNSGEN